MRTGVEIAITDSASGPARKIATELNAIGQSADGINSALDPKILEAYNNQLTQIGEKYSQLKNTEKSFQQQQVSHARQMQSVAGGVGGVATQMSSGDVGGAAVSAGKVAAGFLGGAAGFAVGGVLALAAAGNVVANRYEPRAMASGKIAALSGSFGTDISSNTEALQNAMAETVASVSRYGKTFEEGAQAQEMFLKAGGRDFSGSKAAAYSMAYGADFGRLSAFEGLGERYGQSGGLNAANTIRRQQGLLPGMLEEVMGGIQDSFSQALSRGSIRTMPGISRTQEYFSRAGATWQGGLGAQRVQGLDQAVAGAANLQGQDDLFMYRAASKLSGGDMIKTKMLMEEGMTPELFQGLMGEYKRFGYDKTESILKLSKLPGMNTTLASQLFNLNGQIPGSGKGGGLPGDLGANITTESTELFENLKQGWAGSAGQEAYKARYKLLSGGISAIDNMKVGVLEISDDIVSKLGMGLSEEERNTRSHINQVSAKLDVARYQGVSEGDINSIFMPQYERAKGLSGQISAKEEYDLITAIHTLILSLDTNSEKTEENTKTDIVVEGSWVDNLGKE